MVLVTGATGKVGRNVVSLLGERGIAARALARDPGRADLPAGVEVVQGDLTNPLALAEHLAGIDAVFLVWPLLTADGADDLVSVLTGHARRIVYLSAEAAGRRPDSSWRQVELAIERTGSGWTFLRPTGFASNTLMWADQIRRSDVVRWVYGRAARSLIDERDIAAVAVEALSDADHAGERYVLSGPEALTQTVQVRLIGAALGRDLRWEELPLQAIRDQLSGVPASALDTWASFVATPEVVTSTLEEITGRPARRFAGWARDDAEAFRGIPEGVSEAGRMAAELHHSEEAAWCSFRRGSRTTSRWLIGAGYRPRRTTSCGDGRPSHVGCVEGTALA